MKNLMTAGGVVSGKIYMVETDMGETNSFRLISETPSHYNFSHVTDETVQVFEKAKIEVRGIYNVKEWWLSHTVE